MGALAELVAVELFVPDVSPARIARFQTTPEGRALVAEWGSWAPYYLAQFAARYERLMDRLSDDGLDALERFIDNITAEEFKVVVNRFVGFA